MVFKRVIDDSGKASIQLSIFKKSISDIRSDLKSGFGLKSFRNIVTKEDISNLNQFNTALQNGETRTQSWNKYIKGSTTTIKNQARELISLNDEIKSLNNQRATGKITEQEYNSQMAITQGQISRTTQQTATLTLAQKASTIAWKAWGVAKNIALNVGIGIAINGIITLISSLVNSQNEAIKKAREAAQSLKKETDAIDDYAAKIVELRTKLDDSNISMSESVEVRKELSTLEDELAEKYNIEHERINLITGDIEEQIAVIKELSKKKYDDAKGLNRSGYESAVKKIQNMNVKLDFRTAPNELGDIFRKNGFKEEKKSWHIPFAGDTIPFEITGDAFTVDKAIKGAYKDIEELLKDDTLEQGLRNKYKDVLNYLSSVRSDFSNKIIEENRDIYAQWLEFDDESKYKDQYSSLKTLSARYAQAVKSGDDELTKELAASFSELFTSTVEQAKENGASDVVQFLNDEFEDTISLVNDVADNTSNAAGVASSSLTNITTEIQNLGDTMKSFLDTADKFGEAIGKAVTEDTFDFSEVWELVQLIPELADKFEKAADGKFKIKPEILFDYAIEYGENNNPVTTAYEQSLKVIQEKEKAIAQKKESIANAMASGHNDEYDRQILKQLEDDLEQERINNDTLKSLLDNYNYTLKGKATDEIIANIDSKVDDYNSKIELVQDAISKMNEGAALTHDELQKLAKLFPEVAAAAEMGADGYYIQIDFLDKLKVASYEERNQFIDDRIAETQALYEEVRKRYEILKTLIEIPHINSAADYILYMANKEEFKKAGIDIEQYEKTLAYLESLKGTIFTNNSSSSSSDNSKEIDLIQLQIDYYDTLLHAIETVADRRIKLLQEEKDALQEKNDEEQREIDLIEKKNALDKAKKQKVFVYEKGKGLVQTQDNKAIQDAQKDVEDAELKIKLADIDKQIDAITAYKEIFSDMKSLITDNIEIEQAKKILNTDENGMMNLSKDTISDIQNAYAKALLEKDKKDNEENPYYKVISGDELLKSLGATVNYEEFTKMFSNIVDYPANSVYKGLSSSNNVSNSVYNNSNHTVTISAPIITINDATDPVKVGNVVEEKLNKWLIEINNQIK